jgi:hypothetical protein
MSEPWWVLLSVFALASFGSILVSLILLTLRPGLLRKGRLGSILSAFVERIGDIGGIEVERPEPPPDPRGRLLPFQPAARAEKDEEEKEIRIPEV